MLILFLAALLAVPSFAQVSPTASPTRETLELFEWSERRMEELRFGDDQCLLVQLRKDKAARLWALAEVISNDQRVLWRYTSLLKKINGTKGRVNPLDLELSSRLWSELQSAEDAVKNFKDLARSLGVAEPKNERYQDALKTTRTGYNVGEERYDSDTGAYEIYMGSDTWKPR